MISKLILHVLVPLIIGALIYILFGNPEIYFLKWLGFGGYFNDFAIQHPRLAWIPYNLPDGLWGYSFVALLLILQSLNSAANFMAWFIFCLLIMAMYELLQKLGYINGTGDIIDVTVYFLFGFAAWLNLKPIRNGNI